MHTLGGFSAHGDRDDLLSWVSHFGKGASFFVTHGELKSSESLASGIREIGYDAAVPSAGAVYELSALPGKEPAIVRRASPGKTDARADGETVLALLAEIASETESIRESLDSRGDYREIAPLLESSRLILQSVRNAKPK
jgi:metallo-beta-lactamase family protein